jgi:hypothetical protein
MSGSRQHFTGDLSNLFLFWIVLVVLVWCVPALVMLWFPELSISEREPWLMNPEDLNWKRALFNVTTKPGFRVITALLVGIACIGVRKLYFVLFTGRRLSIRPLRWSGEWIVDERMQSTLLEYGRWVGVVR